MTRTTTRQRGETRQAQATGAIIVAALRDALEHFGPTTDVNRAEVTAWVKARVRERTGAVPHPARRALDGLDAKERQAGE